MAVSARSLPRQKPAWIDGFAGWVTTVDHKRIGILYGFSGFIGFLIAGIEALFIRAQLATSDGRVLNPQQYNELFTMHGTMMVFLAIMPMGGLFFNYLIPLMIGARDVAFPRLNAFSYWLFLFGGLFMLISFPLGNVPDVGWFGYAPLTSREYSPDLRADFWAFGLLVLGTSSLVASFNFIVTIINMRAPGMTMMRMPVFVWMTFVVQWLLALSLPPVTIGLILLVFDRHFGTSFYVPAGGGDPLLWQHLFWVFAHPEVYILILPAFGIVSEVIPVFSRKPLFGYAFVVYSGVAIATLGFGVWAHHMFATGLGPIADSAFSLATMLIAVPTGVKILNWIGTMAGGSISFRSPQLFATGLVMMFIIGGLSGVMLASPPVDLIQTDTYFVIAHFHYVLFGGSVFGIFAGLYYWFPKFTGRLLGESLGKIQCWLLFVGGNLTFFPMHFVGLNGMPRRTATYPAGYGWESLNLIETVGAFIIAIGVLVFIINFFISIRSGTRVGNNPWDGATLEWSIPSPPPEYNFAEVPVVRGRDPLWEHRHGDDVILEPLHPERHALTEVPVHPSAHDLHIHMPNSSWWPSITAATIILVVSGFFFGFPLSIIGVVLLLGSVYAWSMEPAG